MRTKNYLLVLLYFALVCSCSKIQNDSNTNIDKKLSENSIFNLQTVWNTQDSSQIKLRDLQGKVLVMVMIYTSCKAACPRLVADMRDIESQIPKNYLNDLTFVLISIDPKTDKPGRLKRFAKANKMDASH